MIECNPTTTPMDEDIKIQVDMKSKFIDQGYYQSLVGNLIWLTKSRCDLSYDVSCVSR
jgi:hypothetical protein